MSICAYQGCKAYVYHGSRSGLCPAHLHLPGLCKCKRCANLPKQKEQRAGVRAIILPRFDTHSGHDQGEIRISLPAEPWSQK